MLEGSRPGLVSRISDADFELSDNADAGGMAVISFSTFVIPAKLSARESSACTNTIMEMEPTPKDAPIHIQSLLRLAHVGAKSTVRATWRIPICNRPVPDDPRLLTPTILRYRAGCKVSLN
jgi:hypothetical protein